MPTPNPRAELAIGDGAIKLQRAGIEVRPNFRTKPIDYIDPAPKPFVVQIPLVEYFERMTRWKADPWQRDLCDRLQSAAENRHVKGSNDIFHAEPQLGKTIIISQHLPAWCFGHDPLFRFALAMYNTAQSEKHSKVVIRILSSALHKDIFPNKDGWLYQDQGQRERPVQAAVSGWYTNAGRGTEADPGNAGQFSFNPVGLVSGLTGSGFNWLVGDDPYRSEKDAFSPTVNESIRDFLDFLESRRDIYANLSLMFHRYAFDDAAAYCLDKGDFNYFRYATECDGDYIHESTGQKFTDPIGRQKGELISPRRTHEYYAKVKKNPRVWTSMNQGRPQAEGSEFFQVDKIVISPATVAIERRAECSVMVRSYDLAATEKAGDYTVAPLIGMRPDGKTTFFEQVRKQVESAGRNQLMLETAQRDGFDVVISIPEDPGAAGKTTVFHVQELLKGYQVVVRSTSGSKEDRARNLASAVNSGDVEFISDDGLVDDAKWIDITKKEMREFLLSALAHDDTIDSGADGYNECFERISKGLVVKGFSVIRHETDWQRFNEYFKVRDVVPEHWTLYWGVKITPEANVANSAVLVARAARNTGLPDTLFVIAEYKEFTDDFTLLFDWMTITRSLYCPKNQNQTIWLHPDSEQFRVTIWQKLQVPVKLFTGDNVAGVTELNWYLQPSNNLNPFSLGEKASNLYYFNDQTSLRQEFFTWGFDKGEPSKIGAVADCLRMVTYSFRTYATDYTIEEQIERAMPETLRVDALAAMPMSHEKDSMLQSRLKQEREIRQQMNTPIRSAASQRLGRR